MTTPSNGPRLIYLNAHRSLNRDAGWYIEHGERRIETGCDIKGRVDALRQFDEYLKSLSSAEPAPAERPLARQYDKDAPIRIDLAAQIAFPDGSMTAQGLRKERYAGRLETFIIARKEYTTLAAIERMKELCRVSPKEPASSGERKAARQTAACGAGRDGSSKMRESDIALDV